MKVAIINAVYPPEPMVSAQLGRDIVQHMVDAGHEVTVLCPSPSRPATANYSAYEAGRTPKVEYVNGAAIVRLPSYTSPQSKIVSRMRESFSFGCHACRYLKGSMVDVDAVYVNSWPLLSQALLARHCSKNDIPMVLHIQDIYPESLVNKLPGVLKGIISGLLTPLDRWIALKTAHVITISETMRRIYVNGRGIEPNKVAMVLNWVDETRFEKMPERSHSCAHYGLVESKFTFLYLGNIGPVACVELLIDAFHAAELNNAQLVIAGDGSSKQSCIERVSRLRMEQVHFISDPNVDNVPLLQSLGHVCLLPMKKGAGLSSVPSKIMAYLFSAKPVLAPVDAESDTACCIKEAECGWVGEPENVDWLAGKMHEIAGMPLDEIRRMGERGREYGLAHFSKTLNVRRVVEIIETSADRR